MYRRLGIGSGRITTPIVLGIAVVAIVAVAVSIDIIGKPTPHPFAGDWYETDGHRVPDGNQGPLVLDVFRGHEHCGWESATFMMMAWPPGTRIGPPVPVEGDEVRQYVRDPEGAVASELAAYFDPGATLPSDARPAGIRREEWQIFISASQSDRFIYVVSDDAIERWPSAGSVPETRATDSLLFCH